MTEEVISFWDCAPVLQEPQITIVSDISDQSDWSDKSDYSLVTEAARDFQGWITVTAYAIVRSVVRAFRRVVSEAQAVFNRRVFLFEEGLRL